VGETSELNPPPEQIVTRIKPMSYELLTHELQEAVEADTRDPAGKIDRMNRIAELTVAAQVARRTPSTASGHTVEGTLPFMGPVLYALHGRSIVPAKEVPSIQEFEYGNAEQYFGLRKAGTPFCPAGDLENQQHLPELVSAYILGERRADLHSVDEKLDPWSGLEYRIKRDKARSRWVGQLVLPVLTVQGFREIVSDSTKPIKVLRGELIIGSGERTDTETSMDTMVPRGDLLFGQDLLSRCSSTQQTETSLALHRVVAAMMDFEDEAQ
jgi:hypothetical protein